MVARESAGPKKSTLLSACAWILTGFVPTIVVDYQPYTPEHTLVKMAETRRIALSDSLPDGKGRFVVGGQATQAASGELKMYEWRKEVSCQAV